MRRPFNLAALFVAAVIDVWAQEYRASISGTITDPTGAIVAGATVTVTDVLKNTKSDAKTNEAGYYSIPFLLPSKYQVAVQAAGFKRFAREDVVLGVNDRLAVDVTLEVGALSESVTVSGQFGILQTETASRGGAVEQRLVEDLPNNGRNMFQIVFMMPGVYKPSTSQGNSFDIGSGIGNANPSINGTSQGVSGRSWNTEVLVDGVADNRATKDIVTVPALESVQEMQVLTNMYDSSYGHTGGGVVSIVTKSAPTPSMASCLTGRMTRSGAPTQFGQASSFYTTQVPNPFQGLLPNNTALNGANIPRQQLLFAYPQYSALNLGVVPIGKNRHDSVQITARRRFGSGLTFQVNYVISKTLEQLQFLNQQDINLTDYFQSRLDKRLTPFDVPQRLSFIGVYDLPIGKGRKYATSLPWVANLFLGGWTLGWTATYQSGFPIDFPNAAPLDGRSAKLSSDTRNVFRWFDTSLFPKVAGPAPFTLRTFPSRFPDVRFMDFQSWDFNLSKDIPFHEKLKGQVRVTSINALNHPYMTQLASNNVTSTQFGQLALAQNNPSRTFYIDFRLVF